MDTYVLRGHQSLSLIIILNVVIGLTSLNLSYRDKGNRKKVLVNFVEANIKYLD